LISCPVVPAHRQDSGHSSTSESCQPTTSESGGKLPAPAGRPITLCMSFVPVAGNVIPLYSHNTVAPAFAHISEAELYLVYEVAAVNSTHDFNYLIDAYDAIKTRWFGMKYVNAAFAMI